MPSVYYQQKIDQLVQTGYQFEAGKYLSEGWDIFQKNAGSFIGYCTVKVFINMASACFGGIGNLLVIKPLDLGYFIVAKKTDKNEPTEFGDFFKGFDFFGQIVLAKLISATFIVFGFLFFIIPGIYLSVSYGFAGLMVVFTGTEFWPALENSRKLISKKWFSFFGFFILLGLINMLGFLALGVGLLVTIPLTFCSLYSAFNNIVGFEPTETPIQNKPTAEQPTSENMTQIIQ